MPSEWARKKAKELCYFEHDSRHDDKCGNCALIASALDEARAEGEQRGAERERWECNLIAQRQAERYAKTKQGYCVDACLLVRDLIQYRGPMRGPEEE